ncbi:MAG TPA: hypothetical protein VMT00_15710 [Thermoanaerobaculia bacterium]|nr:hypothetical protein [Thermoanaerobaculia bacterium]
MIRRRAALGLILLALPLPLLAWGEKGHYIANEAATFGAPPEMPVFFHQAYARLVYLGYEPDRWKRGGVIAIDDFNTPNHFLDYEYVMHLALPPTRHAYIELLYSSGALRRWGIAVDKPGFVPWHIAELADLLTIQWILWRNAAAGSMEREQIEANIIYVAGTLGHFVADSANPHHATINYNGWVEPNPNGYAIDCGTHSRFESEFIARAIHVADVIPKLSPPRLYDDYFAAGLGLIQESQSLVETLYRIDRDGGFSSPRLGTAEARELATARLATGASLLRDLWWSAYRNSLKPPPRPRR